MTGLRHFVHGDAEADAIDGFFPALCGMRVHATELVITELAIYGAHFLKVTKWPSAADCPACDILLATLKSNTKLPDQKSDTGKTDWSLFPFGAAAHVVAAFQDGAKKYTPWDWREAKDARNRYFSATLRHLAAWQQGETTDAKSGLPALAHACASLLILMAHELKTDGVKK